MNSERMLSLVCVVAVLFVGATATASPLANSNFNSDGDSPAYLAGDLAGQGSDAGDWAGPWTDDSGGRDYAGKFSVVAPGHPGDPDQHLAMYGIDSDGYGIKRAMDPWSGDFKMSYAMRIINDGHNGINRGNFNITLKDSAGKNALHIKVGGTTFPMFIVNNQWMCVQTVDGAWPNNKNLHAEWVKMEIVGHWDTRTFDLYWEQNDGSMQKVNTVVGWKDSTFNGTVVNYRMDGSKVTGDPSQGVEFDNLVFVPEPMTLTLLGLGGLAMLRRRRNRTAN